MRFNKLDLNLLVSLDALLSEMSVTRAAKRLHVTQSAMSSSLARLRDYFEDELLVQVGRRMEMTARAQRLQNEVRYLLARIDSTLAADRDFDPTSAERRVTVQCSDYALQTVMPVALALAEAQNSRVRFELVPVTDERALERGEVDLMILPRAYCSVQHESETLMLENMLCVMWRENPLAEGELTFQRYMAANHVVARPLFGAPPVFDTWFGDTYSRPRLVDVVTYSLASLPHLVVGSHRIATVHGRLARRAAVGLPVVLRPVPAPIPALELAMQWPSSRSEHGVLKWLRGLMHQAMEELDRSLPPLA